jgi:hypothetical protein
VSGITGFQLALERFGGIFDISSPESGNTNAESSVFFRRFPAILRLCFAAVDFGEQAGWAP